MGIGIRCIIAVLETTVVFQITEMNERLRTPSGQGTLWHSAALDLEICSSEYPGLEPNRVYVRGANRAKDLHVATLEFSSRAEAEDYALRVCVALKAFAAQGHKA